MSVTTGTGAKKTSGSDNWRTIIGAHNDTVDVYDKVKAAAAIFASAYDSTATYAAGDQCTHDGKWYVANQAISTAEDWTAAHWTEITIASKLDTANVYNGLDKTASGFALDARQGKSLNEAIANTQSGLAIVANGNTHPAIGAGQFVYVKNHGTLADGLYTNKSGATIAANDTLTSSNLQAESSGGFNSLNSKFATMRTAQTLLSKNVALTASYASTGETITVPSPGFVTIRMNYNGALPVAMGLKSGQTDGGTSWMYGENANKEESVSSFTIMGIVGTGTYYVWGKAKSSATNEITVQFYPMG